MSQPVRPLVERLQDEADLCRNDGADDIAALLDKAVAEIRGLVQTLRDELDENLRLRELGGALPDENITAMTERLIRERDNLRAQLAIAARGLKHCAGWNINDDKRNALMSVVLESEALLAAGHNVRGNRLAPERSNEMTDQAAGASPVDRGVRPGATTFADWYATNERYLTTQPYTNYVAAAAWNAGQAAEQTRWSDAAAGMAKAAADNNDLRVYELLRGLNDALYRA